MSSQGPRAIARDAHPFCRSEILPVTLDPEEPM